jgi:hypothetical protein
MEIDQELALIKKNKAPMGLVAPGSVAVAAPPATAPAAPPLIEAATPAPITPAAVDLPKAPSQLDAELGLPAFDAETPAPPVVGASTWEVMGAAWEAETIKTDAWSYAEGKRQELAHGMFEQLSPEGQRKVRARAEQAPTGDVAHDWQTFQGMVMEQATAEAEADPQAAARFAPFPMTEEDFQKRINTERRRDYDKAQGVLDQPGGGFAEFLGASARALTDEINLPLLPLGVTGSTWRVIAGEGALNATAEALGLPREFAVASELDLPPPDAVSRIAMGAALGSGIAGALIGIGKGASKALGLSRTYAETRKVNAGNLAAEHGIDAAEAKMRGEQSVQEVLGTPAATAKFSGVADAGKGYTVLIGPDGQAVRRDGTRAWRNNNPGNIEFGPFAKAHGAIGTDGRFAVFPSYEAGRAAKGALLFESKGYRDLTIGEAIARYAPSFENDTGAYTRAVTKSIGATSGTRMADLTPQQRGLMLSAMERVEGFRPGKENGVSVAGRTAAEDAPSYTPTSRGYTESGQIAVGDNLRIDVKYEVVDATSLLRASGDLQPRDRSRANSDAWISDTAARLDPAQLMPAPTADRGTPIVGPDQTIESGNGRVGAIERAYERHPDRAAAYRSQIEAAGYAIPEGVQRPVLIARRTSEITPEQRRQLVIDAQDSGVAQMTPTEVAQTASRAMDAQALARLDPSQPLDHADNLNFLGRALSLLPKSSRNAMAASDGSLNQSARRMLREAIFARAWRDPDMVELFTEAEQGQLKGLMDALGDAAPHWAVLQAEIEAGLVRPEMDISGFVLDAMRLIANARTLATQSKIKINFAISELLEEIDLVAGPVSPLTVALVKKFWRNGHATKAEEVAQFLSRYADDARMAGKTGDIFDQPSPRDVLAAIEPKLFSDLPEDIGQARGFARKTPAQDAPAQGYDTGAESPEALAADQAARDALEKRVVDTPQTSDASGANGKADANAKTDTGQSAAPADLGRAGGDRSAPGGGSAFDAGGRSGQGQAQGVTAPNTPKPIDPQAAAIQADLYALRGQYADQLDSLEIDLGGGNTVTAREIFADLDADAQMAAAVRACAISPGGA